MTPEAMATLHAAAFTDARPWSAEEFLGLLDSPGTFFTSRPQGFALGRAIAGEADLLTIAVHPDARRQGLGRRLLAGFEAAARARHAVTAFLDVAADNAPAIALYTAAGYRQTGRRKGYYPRPGQPPVDAVLMMRPLCGTPSAANSGASAR